MNELLVEGNLDVADEVFAPDYVNFALGVAMQSQPRRWSQR
jgi:hypothetical protein